MHEKIFVHRGVKKEIPPRAKFAARAKRGEQITISCLKRLTYKGIFRRSAHHSLLFVTSYKKYYYHSRFSDKK